MMIGLLAVVWFSLTLSFSEYFLVDVTLVAEADVVGVFFATVFKVDVESLDLGSPLLQTF